MNSLEEYFFLSSYQKNLITNGCGPKFGPIGLLVPDFIFTEACDVHDWLYWCGGEEQDRLEADLVLKSLIKESISVLPWYKRMLYFWAPIVYFKAVRVFGANAFHYGAKRTIKDIGASDAQV